MDYRRRAYWALAIAACFLLLIAPALWNGFALLQYDTGGYLAPWYDGRLEMNRPVPYGLLLVAGHWFDFWPVLIVQSVLTIWVLALTLRAEGLSGRPGLLLGAIAALSVFTTLPWLTAILLTDIFAGLSVLALYLLLLRDDTLRSLERIGSIALVAASASIHSATIAVLLGLVIIAIAIRLIDRARMPTTRLLRATAALTLGALMVTTANGAVTGQFGWAPGGYALSFGRMLQDGIVTRYLNDHCPDPALRLCPYKNALPLDPDDFFWGESVFDKLGRFDGMHDEMRHIVLASLTEYPLLQLRSMAIGTVEQLALVETGAGVVNWIRNTYDTIKTHVPAATPAMLAARQQHGTLPFDVINWLHVPVALLTVALLPFIAALGWRRPRFARIGELAATVALAILGNAAVFGILATAHNRYGARVIWLAPLVCLIALWQWRARWS
jgi:hypothetical protein